MVGECGFGFFNCSAGGCIDINQVCDGLSDCQQDGDMSDEEGCRKLRERERERKRREINTETGENKREGGREGRKRDRQGRDGETKGNRCS